MNNITSKYELHKCSTRIKYEFSISRNERHGKRIRQDMIKGDVLGAP